MRILFPLPSRDFDPTETALPWSVLVDAGHEVVFATPDGQPAAADARIVTGHGFALWRLFLRAVSHARGVYAQMEASEPFQQPLAYEALDPEAFDGVFLTGGHAPHMKPYLESRPVQALVAAHMAADKPVGAICHGVLVVARACDPDTGRSVLYGRKTTSLLKTQEMAAWAMTGLWLGSYYRTYTLSVQDEVTQALASPRDFLTGPFLLRREGPKKLDYGFTVRDRNYLSARYYTDSYKFAHDFAALVSEYEVQQRAS